MAQAVGRGRWGVRLAAALTGLMGVVNVLSAVTPRLAWRLHLLQPYAPLEVRRGGHLAAALAGFALLLLAGGLWHHKRMAWLLTLLVLVISAVSQLVKGLDYEEALGALALAIILVPLRHHYHARSDAPSARQGLRALVAAFLFTLAYGITGFYLLDRHFSINFGLAEAARQTVGMFAAFQDPGLHPVTRFGRFFADSVYMVGAATMAYALLMLLRPVLIRVPATAAERAQAEAIVQAHGRSSIARYTLLGDKSYHFTPGGSVVAYVVRGPVALALGDPVGPPGDAALAIASFRDLCAPNDWQSAFYQTLPDYVDHYRAQGFEALCIGNEAVVDLSRFRLEGGENKSVRSAVNRMTKMGYSAELAEPPLDEVLLDELAEVSDEWLARVKGAEKRFSLGYFDDDYLRSGPVMVVRGPDGAATAFANIVSEYQLSGITIDLMRQRAGVERGTMEFLFVRLFEWAREQGYAEFSLGLSALAGVGQAREDPAAERALNFIFEHIDQFYSFKGLHTFKDKFHPEWRPRYLVYPGAASLPAVALALIRADSGESFVWDYMRGLFR
jgi:phosphatidylglycerol lysyltransferase